MAYFLVVGNPDDGEKQMGSVTAYNMNDVHMLHLVVDEAGLLVDLGEQKESILVDRYKVCHESTVDNEMLSMSDRMKQAKERINQEATK
jgi:hypothetical protein